MIFLLSYLFVKIAVLISVPKDFGKRFWLNFFAPYYRSRSTKQQITKDKTNKFPDNLYQNYYLSNYGKNEGKIMQNLDRKETNKKKTLLKHKAKI